VPCYLSIQDRDFRILETNALFKRNFGDLKGELCHKAYKGRDSVCTNCPAAKSLQDGASHSSEEIVITRDGEAAHMIVYSMPLRNDRGEIDRVMEMSTNITEVKKLQRELTTIGKAVAGMAHRVKNILMGLEGGIFVVNTGMETQDNDTIEEGWEMIERNVGKVSKIVKDMLFCSKTREPVFEEVSPEEIAREVYALFKSRVEDEGIAFHLEVSDDPHEGLFDPDSLHSLMTNLVTNAIGACKFDMNEGKGRHTIILRCLKGDDGETVVEVSDNGSGMAEEVQSKIFNDLFSTKGSEGTGFGLLVAQKVVEEHGGTLTFESKEGQGTTFRAVFPPQGSVE
jgi:signal transduction histidine kinase